MRFLISIIVFVLLISFVYGSFSSFVDDFYGSYKKAKKYIASSKKNKE